MSFLLQEDGSKLLLEDDSGSLLLETPVPSPVESSAVFLPTRPRPPLVQTRPERRKFRVKAALIRVFALPGVLTVGLRVETPPATPVRTLTDLEALEELWMLEGL